VDVLLTLSRGPWTAHTAYNGQLNGGTGVGISDALDPQGDGAFHRIDTDVSYRDRWSDTWEVTGNFSYVNIKTDTNLELFPPGAFFNRFPEGVKQRLGIDEERIRTELIGEYTGFASHRLRLGAGGVIESLRNVEDRRNYTIVGGVPLPTGRFEEGAGIGDRTLFPSDSRDNFFAYAQDEWALARDWTLTSGVRVDRYSDVGEAVNPRAGLIWTASPSLTTKLLYGRAFRPPSFVELHSNGLYQGLGNPNLKPVTIDNVELVIDYRLPRFRTALSTFWYSVEDIIKLISSPTSPNGFAYTNGDEQRGYGFEWEVGVLP
jgi:iron complex outermembrane receptor protein